MLIPKILQHLWVIFPLLPWPKLPPLSSYKLSLPEHHLTKNPKSSAGPCFSDFPGTHLVMWRSNVFPEVLFHGFLHVLQSGFSAEPFVHGLISVQKPLALKPGWDALPQGSCQAQSYCRDWTSALKSPSKVKRLLKLMTAQPREVFLTWSTVTTTKKKPPHFDSAANYLGY